MKDESQIRFWLKRRYLRQDIYTKNKVIESLTKKVTEMERNLEVKDDIINDLVLSIKNVEDQQNKSKVKDQEKKIECVKCKLKANSVETLDVHIW